MPRTRSLAWSELKIGVLTIIALGITALTIFMLTGGRGFFWQRYRLKTRFGNVAGLKPGSPVRVAGVEVGTGEGGRPRRRAGRHHAGSEQRRARPDHQHLDGDARVGVAARRSAVDITPSTKGSPIPEWGYVPAAAAPAQLSDITETANQGIQKISALLDDVRSGRGTIGKLMTDEQLYDDLHRFVATAGEVTQGIRQGAGRSASC